MANEDVLHMSILVDDLNVLLSLPEPTEAEIHEGINNFVRNYYYCEKLNG